MPLSEIKSRDIPRDIRIRFNDGYFTEKEKQIVLQMLQGHENRAIAETLSIGEGTVRNRINAIYAKLQDDIGIPSDRVSRGGLFFCLLEYGLIDLTSSQIFTTIRR